MALFNCPECSGSASELASSCPKCGFAFTRDIIAESISKKKKIEQIGGGIFVVVILIFGFGIAGGNGTSSPTTTPNEDWSTSGSGKCGPVTRAQLIVKQSLKSPQSASFPWSMNEYQVSGYGSDWKVVGYVDSENSFGAKIQTRWAVEFVNSQSGGLERVKVLSFD